MTDLKPSKSGAEISLADLHPTYRKMAAVIGIENTLALGREFGGMSIYFPKVRAAILLKSRHQTIIREFNGRNYAELARKHHLTEAWVREIVKRERKAK